MEPRPTPDRFGRSRQLQQPSTVTQGQVLELKNGLWDAQQEIVRLRQRDEARHAELEHVISALTHLDSELYELKRRPDYTIDVETLPVTAADWTARGEAWEQLIAAISIYARQGVTGDELAAVLAQATVEVQIRTGINTGKQS